MMCILKIVVNAHGKVKTSGRKYTARTAGK